ncbi:putative choline transport protein [Talaromyces proteolyticus]|uniref:Choline transport protein n=1 Tax=Talaromyces proteolyticus TaxID=1131652 RepID=A0AAD4KND5_9EURO|nr:putative choline transport protein [Talaromyces proteolyticus]KAH8694190.1 putative choline transport protein [Talaromyces proteolyticus]
MAEKNNISRATAYVGDESPKHPVDSAINASGHRQELDQNFSLLSICGIAVTLGNTWIALGGGLAVAINNGGPAGVIYEFIAVSIMYWFVSASIAELASAIPSTSGVYQWASLTAGPYGRIVGWFTGYWNCLCWILGGASMSAIMGNQIISIYALFHPEFSPQAWHVFVAYLCCTWLCCATVLFANRALPMLSNVGMFFIIAGVTITIIVCAVMPTVNGTGHASNQFVWSNWQNGTGYSSNGFVFLAGMLNGAFAVGTSDCTTHLAEEIPRPSVNIPKAILAQVSIGFVSAFVYMIAIFYAINDLDAILASNSTFPLADIYLQATGSRGGALGLLILAFLPTLINAVGCYITAGRILWALARDKACPFDSWVGKVSKTFHNPFNATLACGVIITVMGGIYVGSTTAFNAFVGSYVILSSMSYLGAILPHLLSGRSNVTPGPFWMKGATGYIVNGISCTYIIVFVVIFCFPASLPVDATNMNYSCLITGGLTVFVAALWFWYQHDYTGPQAVPSSQHVYMGESES